MHPFFKKIILSTLNPCLWFEKADMVGLFCKYCLQWWYGTTAKETRKKE